MAGRTSPARTTSFGDSSHRLKFMLSDGIAHLALRNAEAMAQRPSHLGLTLQHSILRITEFHETSSSRKEYRAGFAEG